MIVNELVHAVEDIAPLEYAESWDNVGLLIGDESRELRGPVMLTIDLTEPVISEAREKRCDAVIAYHPPIFKPLTRVGGRSGPERIVLSAVEAGLAVYSPHTALDAAPGGMTDWLADGVLPSDGESSADRRALAPHDHLPDSQQLKIVTFVPADKLDDVRGALATAGAGQIGDYEACSFAARGKGTFFGGKGTNPAVGVAENFEVVDEMRLEMVCARYALPIVLETLNEFHPYEEPAIDVYELVGHAVRSTGAGRRLMLDRPATIEEIAGRMKQHLRVDAVKVAALTKEPIRRVGVCPGAGAKLAPAALADGCELFITGEMRYHEVKDTLHAGMSVILAGHTNTERGYLPHLSAKLHERLASIQFLLSEIDRTPFAIY